MCILILLVYLLFLSHFQQSSAAPCDAPSQNDTLGDTENRGETDNDFWDALPPIDTLTFSDDQLAEWLTDFLPNTADYHDIEESVLDNLLIDESRPQTPVNTPVHQAVSSLFGSPSRNPFLQAGKTSNRRRNSARQSSKSRRQETRDISIPLVQRGRPLLQRSSTDPHARVKLKEERSQSSLRGRKGVYDETREHACEECGKRFARGEHVNRHIRSVHTKERPFECSICHKSFSRSDNRFQHLKTHEAQSK